MHINENNTESNSYKSSNIQVVYELFEVQKKVNINTCERSDLKKLSKLVEKKEKLATIKS